ncbi:hypothetical protein [Loktanella sp. Alg231-35]|uniref:hypothetical protein n=1 Tax=Loktanella sp. Alg231-35 TaxID=1922220 RepID=UPI00131F04C7|nr:hypothetical protein [Loktanella sp. Alg231-35]
MATNAQGEAVFGVPDVVTSPLDHASNVRPIVAVDVVYTELDPPSLGTIQSNPVDGCETALTAKRHAAAMIELTVSAPCLQEEDFVIQHESLVIAGVTDDEGLAVIMAPALLAQASFSVAFDNVLEATTDIFVPEIRQYDRAVLQWQTADNMRLHALEGGAGIGDAGHIWSASIHTAEDARAGTNGFVAFLGSTDTEIPYQAEVYTFPSGQASRDGGVTLMVGVGVTKDNCAREIDAATIQTSAGQILAQSDVIVQMPACDQVGEVALQDDKFTDLQLASN